MLHLLCNLRKGFISTIRATGKWQASKGTSHKCALWYCCMETVGKWGRCFFLNTLSQKMHNLTIVQKFEWRGWMVCTILIGWGSWIVIHAFADHYCIYSILDYQRKNSWNQCWWGRTFTVSETAHRFWSILLYEYPDRSPELYFSFLSMNLIKVTNPDLNIFMTN